MIYIDTERLIIKSWCNTPEEGAIKQAKNLANLPFIFKQVCLMPDTHEGYGMPIGGVIAAKGVVIPNAVGVDIGCGMLTVNLGKTNLDFGSLDSLIRKFIPSGMNTHSEPVVGFSKLRNLKCYRRLKNPTRIECSIGTLGGGNHFIEVDTDDAGSKYLVVHTGSRNLGKQVADYYQHLAYELLQGKETLLEEQKRLIASYRDQGRQAEIQEALKKLPRVKDVVLPKDLAYLTGKHREDYLHDMEICQEYASLNRDIIAKIILSHLRISPVGCFETIHNYIDHESNVVRKGAISAKKGEMLLIPINMRDGCIIGVGKGNEDWNCSAPHGAGRLMSRAKARQSLGMKAYQDSMRGIYTTSVCSNTIDEAPMAYKGIEEIMSSIGDTVDIIKVIKPVYNYKATE